MTQQQKLSPLNPLNCSVKNKKKSQREREDSKSYLRFACTNLQLLSEKKNKLSQEDDDFLSVPIDWFNWEPIDKE